jgi:hypothetical protein
MARMKNNQKSGTQPGTVEVVHEYVDVEHSDSR